MTVPISLLDILEYFKGAYLFRIETNSDRYKTWVYLTPDKCLELENVIYSEKGSKFLEV
jgi:hypothetical protein